MKFRNNHIFAAIGLAFAPLYAASAEAVSAGTAAAKPPKFAKKEYDLDTKVVSIEFGNGKVLELDCNDLSDEMKVQLMLHGAAQKVGDSYAGAKGNFNVGIESAQGVIDQLKAGEWRGAGDEARPRLAELAAAIARIRGLDKDEAGMAKVTAAVEKADDNQRKAWRSNPQVKAMIAQQRAEKAAAALEGAPKEEVVIDLG